MEVRAVGNWARQMLCPGSWKKTRRTEILDEAVAVPFLSCEGIRRGGGGWSEEELRVQTRLGFSSRLRSFGENTPAHRKVGESSREGHHNPTGGSSPSSHYLIATDWTRSTRKETAKRRVRVLSAKRSTRRTPYLSASKTLSPYSSFLWPLPDLRLRGEHPPFSATHHLSTPSDGDDPRLSSASGPPPDIVSRTLSETVWRA